MLTQMKVKHYQLLEVVLDCVGVNHHTNGYQGVKGKVKDLVAEEGNDPSGMLLKNENRNNLKCVLGIWMQQWFWIILYYWCLCVCAFPYLVSTIGCHTTYKDHDQGNGCGYTHVWVKQIRKTIVIIFHFNGHYQWPKTGVIIQLCFKMHPVTNWFRFHFTTKHQPNSLDQTVSRQISISQISVHYTLHKPLWYIAAVSTVKDSIFGLVKWLQLDT